MTALSEPDAGDIWLGYLYFLDDPQLGKVRPILIANKTKKKDVYIALKITTKNKPNSLFLNDWEALGLVQPSYVVLNQIFEIHKSSLLREEPLGKLDAKSFNQILKLLEWNSFL